MKKVHVTFNQGATIIPCISAGPNVNAVRYVSPQEFVKQSEKDQCSCCAKEVRALQRRILARKFAAIAA